MLATVILYIIKLEKYVLSFMGIYFIMCIKLRKCLNTFFYILIGALEFFGLRAKVITL